MESFHHKNSQCENCGLAIEEVGLLQIINFWQNINSRLFPYYLYVCDSCFESRELWCDKIFPEHCEICNKPIEDGDHCLDKKLNQENESIASFGLIYNEKCKIICPECHKSNN